MSIFSECGDLIEKVDSKKQSVNSKLLAKAMEFKSNIGLLDVRNYSDLEPNPSHEMLITSLNKVHNLNSQSSHIPNNIFLQTSSYHPSFDTDLEEDLYSSTNIDVSKNSDPDKPVVFKPLVTLYSIDDEDAFLYGDSNSVSDENSSFQNETANKMKPKETYCNNYSQNIELSDLENDQKFLLFPKVKEFNIAGKSGTKLIISKFKRLLRRNYNDARVSDIVSAKQEPLLISKQDKGTVDTYSNSTLLPNKRCDELNLETQVNIHAKTNMKQEPLIVNFKDKALAFRHSKACTKRRDSCMIKRLDKKLPKRYSNDYFYRNESKPSAGYGSKIKNHKLRSPKRRRSVSYSPRHRSSSKSPRNRSRSKSSRYRSLSPWYSSRNKSPSHKSPEYYRERSPCYSRPIAPSRNRSPSYHRARSSSHRSRNRRRRSLERSSRLKRKSHKRKTHISSRHCSRDRSPSCSIKKETQILRGGSLFPNTDIKKNENNMEKPKQNYSSKEPSDDKQGELNIEVADKFKRTDSAAILKNSESSESEIITSKNRGTSDPDEDKKTTLKNSQFNSSTSTVAPTVSLTTSWSAVPLIVSGSTTAQQLNSSNMHQHVLTYTQIYSQGLSGPSSLQQLYASNVYPYSTNYLQQFISSLPQDYLQSMIHPSSASFVPSNVYNFPTYYNIIYPSTIFSTSFSHPPISPTNNIYSPVQQ